MYGISFFLPVAWWHNIISGICLQCRPIWKGDNLYECFEISLEKYFCLCSVCRYVNRTDDIFNRKAEPTIETKLIGDQIKRIKKKKIE